jgi:hypothetical protein
MVNLPAPLKPLPSDSFFPYKNNMKMTELVRLLSMSHTLALIRKRKHFCLNRSSEITIFQYLIARFFHQHDIYII